MSRDASKLLIRGGRVVDGTGAPARRAHVRLRGDTITEIGVGKYTSSRPGRMLAPSAP